MTRFLLCPSGTVSRQSPRTFPGTCHDTILLDSFQGQFPGLVSRNFNRTSNKPVSVIFVSLQLKSSNAEAALHLVTEVTTVARLLYASPALIVGFYNGQGQGQA